MSRSGGAALPTIQSMTGAATAAGSTEVGQVTVESRSVNGRTLAVKLRLGSECQGIEAALEAVVRQRIQRGSVHLTLLVTESSEAPDAALDPAQAVRVAAELEVLGARLGKKVRFADVLAVPGVIRVPSRAPRLSRELPPDLLHLVGQALNGLVADREREGRDTVVAMLGDIAALDAAVARVREIAPEVVVQHRDRLLQRVNEFLEGRGRTMEQHEVVREIAVFAERVDITEEIERLTMHTLKARQLLEGPGPAGRSLEFLAQEMLREVNTLGSKSPDAAIAHLVVEMKSRLDKVKEQAANLE